MAGECDRVSVVIPARNESVTIRSVVAALRGHPLANEIIVVDSASTDDTAALAAAEGARIVRLEEPGYGRALKAGIRAARNRWVFKLDGDMRNVAQDWLSAHVAALRPSVGLVKSYWESSEDPMPVTNLVVNPALRLLIPSLSFVRMPISGIFLFDKTLIEEGNLPDDFACDLEILIRIHRLGAGIAQVELGEVLDHLKPVPNYVGMAGELLRCLHMHAAVERAGPLMLVMAHPDDAEIWCGGTLAKFLNRGGMVDLWIMTGSPVGDREAGRLREIYQNLRIHSLGGEPFQSADGRASVLRLGKAMADVRPRTLITHHFADCHPDHQAAYELASGACMFVDRGALPTVYLCNTYFQTPAAGRLFAPNTFIDISAEADFKYRMIAFHESQDVEHWIRMARAMDELNGAKCGVGKAEAFQKISFYAGPPAADFF
jgi:LmbE family N-acetylglucosaminyl deacetylase